MEMSLFLHHQRPLSLQPKHQVTVTATTGGQHTYLPKPLTTNSPPRRRLVPKPNQTATSTAATTRNGGRGQLHIPDDDDDRTLKSTWSHRAWFGTGCTTVLVSLARCMMLASATHTWVEPILAGFVGYIMADLASGIVHWGIDNYGDASTPIFGPQIEAAQGHHKWPRTIARRQVANNLHAVARTTTFAMLPIHVAPHHNPTLLGFVAVFSGCAMLSQQIHAWAHCTDSELPPLVVALQKSGVILSRSVHRPHHRLPFNNGYCIVNGVWNNLLDHNNVFEALEMALFCRLGVRPQSWICSEPPPSFPDSESIHHQETT
ncbi:hypothetical protein Dimus_019128 [Dionaea muscipula]